MKNALRFVMQPSTVSSCTDCGRLRDVFEETDHDYVLKTVHTDLLIPKTSPVKKVAR